MSRSIWKTAAAEAAERGRDVIGLRFVDAADAAQRARLAEAVRNALHPLDDRWTAGMRKAPASIKRDYDFQPVADGGGCVRLVSPGTADLFGATPSTSTVGKLADLVRDTRDLATLREQLANIPAQAVDAYGRLLAELAKIPATAVFEFAMPTGAADETELEAGHMREALSYMEETNISSLVIRVRGSLTGWNPAGVFRLEGEDGRIYAGKMAAEIRRRYGRAEERPALPTVVEALVERSSVYRPSIDARSEIDTMIELDADPGESLAETLHACRKLYDRLSAALEHDGVEKEHALSPLSAADYAELAELAGRLSDSNPDKGARKAIRPPDLADMRLLLAEGKPIGRLALLTSGGGNEPTLMEDDDYAGNGSYGSAAYEASRRAALDRQKLAAAAFSDIVRLTGRLSNIIEALREADDGAEGANAD